MTFDQWWEALPMSDIATVRVGDVMPGCESFLRPDGTIEHGSMLHDPIRLHVVLAADISPSHEQAIIDASGGDGADAAGIYTDDATRPRLWMWWIDPALVGMGCAMWLRPRHEELPLLQWWMRACDCYIDSYRQTAREWLSVAQAMPTRGLPAQLVVVGRDARVLMISRVACHNAISQHWMALIAQAHLDPPYLARQPHFHICGQPDLTSDPNRWLIEHGWIETPQQERLRRRRLRARQRQRRAGR